MIKSMPIKHENYSGTSFRQKGIQSVYKMNTFDKLYRNGNE